MAYLYSNNICIDREFIIVGLPVADARNRVLSRGGSFGGVGVCICGQ